MTLLIPYHRVKNPLLVPVVPTELFFYPYNPYNPVHPIPIFSLP